MKKILVSILISLVLLTTLALPAIAAEEEASTTASVSVGEFVNITLSGAINFGSITPPAVDQCATGQEEGIPAITITVEAETNVVVDLSIKAAITSGSLALPNWKYSTTFTGTKTSLTGAYVEVYDSAPEGANEFYHWIDVPAGTASGNHQISVDYKAATHTP